ncbi:MAG: hypothetical protein J6W23_06715 [Victivallales bacterium]|jgi:hypothetical protein|nr:hypothetical protein [Victivallales bacterium]MCR5380172.1 hypothetical protein [Lentisphaeria bacterium]MBQ2337269.1 hypothetical protein [Victivallales bacterium]MBR3648664.1 hypothetical protein [Victivallales bacterium]MBR4900853.1 hypothetical protein [Victivallales bacterium]
MARRNTNSDLDLLLGGGETKSTRKRKTTPAPNGPVAGNPSGPAMAGGPSGPAMSGGPSGPAMSGGPSGPAMAGGEAPKRRRKTLKDNDTLRQLLG